MEDRTEKVIRLDEQVHNIEEKIDRVIAMLEGNGKPGVLVRVDRLEQTAEAQQWVSRAVLGAVIVLLVGFAFEVVTKFESIKGEHRESSTGGTGTSETN